MAIAVHVTHEAVHKVGGIGAVLQGLLTSSAYRRHTERTFLVGPLLDRHRSEPLGPEGVVLYDNWNGTWSDQVGPALLAAESRHGVRLVYGRRAFSCPDGDTIEAEVLLVDVEGSVPRGLAQFKYLLFQVFGLASDQYEAHWEYEQYVRLAEPAFEAVTALIGARSDTPVHLIAHEFMGLPTAFRAMLEDDPGIFTVFYAHEVATARRLVESLPGADLAFYGALRAAVEAGQFVDQAFGSQGTHYKHALVARAWRCDGVFAVGDRVVEELRFLGPEFADRELDRVYNGVPDPAPCEPEERDAARQRLAGVAEGLLGWRPDLVFTHVGRLVPSKGLWRDLQVLGALETHLEARGATAALLVLATEAGPRPPASVRQMRGEYGWPLVHREGYPDLTPGELTHDLEVRRFNARSRRSKAIFVNQFGFDADHLGGAVADDVGFEDLRRGSDAEFGLSTYEPFGIAQIEPVAFGALSLVSDVCGCVGFLREAGKDLEGPDCFLVGDYTGEDPGAAPSDLAGWRAVSKAARQRREQAVGDRLAAALAEALPEDAQGQAALLRAGGELAARMSWERVVEDQYLPALERMEARRRDG